MLIFSVSGETTYGEAADIVEWCMENCDGRFYISPLMIFNPMSLFYYYFLKYQWKSIKDQWKIRGDSPFVYGAPSYIIFDKKSDASFFKLTHEANDVKFICQTFY